MDDTNAAAGPNFDPQIHQRLLRKGSERLGFPLTDAQLAQFETYQRALVEWNSRFNLTAITDYEEVQVKHFLDCLAGLPPLLEELGEATAPARSRPSSQASSSAYKPRVARLFRPAARVATACPSSPSRARASPSPLESFWLTACRRIMGR